MLETLKDIKVSGPLHFVPAGGWKCPAQYLCITQLFLVYCFLTAFFFESAHLIPSRYFFFFQVQMTVVLYQNTLSEKCLSDCKDIAINASLFRRQLLISIIYNALRRHRCQWGLGPKESLQLWLNWSSPGKKKLPGLQQDHFYKIFFQ